jgi:hypothetical protein
LGAAVAYVYCQTLLVQGLVQERIFYDIFFVKTIWIDDFLNHTKKFEDAFLPSRAAKAPVRLNGSMSLLHSPSVLR